MSEDYFTKAMDEVLKEFEVDIDTEKPLYETTTKPVPKKWIEAVLIDTVQKCLTEFKDNVLDSRFLSNENTYLITLSSSKAVDDFIMLIRQYLIPNLNQYIKNKGDNPKNYHRAVIFETKKENNRLTIMC